MTRGLRVPAWAPTLSLVICAAGLGVSGYLTYEHFTSSSSLACPETATLNCLKVTTSEWSMFLGIPVAVLGLVFFAGMGSLCLPVLWRVDSSWLRRARVAGAVVGVAFAIYLIWAELYRIDSICLWCTVAHALSVALAVVVLLGTAYLEPAERAPVAG